MSPIRIVVTGTRGQVVRSLLEIAASQEIEVVAVGRPDLDLADSASVGSAIVPMRPQLIVSAAAYTDTERAEIEPDVAEAVNVGGAGALAACARRLGIPIIHLSTGYVFDGTSPTPYRESDVIGPLNVYGRSKAMGELAVAAAQPEHVIVRTSWAYSPFGRNFVTSMLKRASLEDEVDVVCDQIGNPTSAADLAAGILTVVRNLVERRIGEEGYGIFHMSTQEPATPAELAAATFAASAERGGPSARVVPITSAQYRSRVTRPPNARLDCSKIAAVHGVTVPAWRSSLPACIDRILCQSR